MRTTNTVRKGSAGGEFLIGLAVVVGLIWACGGFGSSRKAGAPAPTGYSLPAAYQDPYAASRAMGNRMSLRNAQRQADLYDHHRHLMKLRDADNALWDAHHYTR